MKYINVFVIFLLLLSCSQDKSVLLPEIQNASITEVTDISPAYIFYDVTQPDSVELNRKNLIGTTNWLFNVDKRLSLKQAIPKIMFLQDKKRNKQMHKNEKAKNYFTCNDTGIQNLGFIEFTDVIYDYEIPENLYGLIENSEGLFKPGVFINVVSEDSLQMDIVVPKKPFDQDNDDSNLNTDKGSTDILFKRIAYQDLVTEMKALSSDSILVVLHFNQNLKFQSYISIKSMLSKLIDNQFVIYDHEFIY